MMEKMSIYIDHQTTRPASQYRVQVQVGTGNDREFFDASYCKTRQGAEKVKKTLRRVFSKIHKREVVLENLSQTNDYTRNQDEVDEESIPPSNG
jgi:hypothetical protein